MKRYTLNNPEDNVRAVSFDIDNSVYTGANYEYQTRQAFEHGRNEKGEDLTPECSINNAHELVHAALVINPQTIARWNKGYIRERLFNQGYWEQIREWYGEELLMSVGAWADKLPESPNEVRRRFSTQNNKTHKPAVKPTTQYTKSVVDKLKEGK